MGWSTHWAASCQHPVQERRAYTQTNGVVVHVMQCMECGSLLRNVKKDGDPPAFDVNLRDSVMRDMEMAHKNEQWNLTVARDQERRERKELYQQYLRSEVWREKRALVLRRCGHICEACLTARATEVHHEQYPKELGTEPLFWLRGVCRPCHELIHTTTKDAP